jgi:hypothetical protein
LFDGSKKIVSKNVSHFRALRRSVIVVFVVPGFHLALSVRCATRGLVALSLGLEGLPGSLKLKIAVQGGLRDADSVGEISNADALASAVVIQQ